MFITAKLQFIFHRLKEHINQFKVKSINNSVKKWLLNKDNFIRYFTHHQSDLFLHKLEFLNSIQKDQKIIFYVFRDLHLVDWFLPIHQALETSYPGKYSIFYVNFGSTLKKVGDGIAYLPYLNQINQRLKCIPGAEFQHFADQEINLFTGFPQPDLILTTETIRKENFNAAQRVYLPHYTVPKADDTLPAKIKYSHVFLPTNQQYSYRSLIPPNGRNIKMHEVGYPKMKRLEVQKNTLFHNDDPIIIFAPSLDNKLIQSFIKQGILDIFKSMKNLNFVLKLHPTLSTKMHYLYTFLSKDLANQNHIRIDTKSNIQDIGVDSNLMIADFGSVGAEYRLSFGKRVIYLDLPPGYEGGADLKFRDDFADAISTVEGLANALESVLKKGNISQEELTEMRDKVLFHWQDADMKAAHSIHKILQ